MTLWASSRGGVATNRTAIGQVGRVSEVCVSEDELREALGFERMRRRAHTDPDDFAASGWIEEATASDLAARLELEIRGHDAEELAGWWYDAPEGASRRWCLGVRLAAAVGLHGPRRRGAGSSSGGSIASARGAAREERGPSAWARSRGVRIGDFGGDASELGEFTRIDARWVTLKADVVRAFPAEGDTPRAVFRRNFVDAFSRWRAFYNEARGDLFALHSTVDQAHAFDAELETWRARFVELGGTPSHPTTSHTAPRPPDRAGGMLGEIGDVVRIVAIAVIVLGIAWAVSSASSVAPRLVGAATPP